MVRDAPHDDVARGELVRALARAGHFAAAERELDIISTPGPAAAGDELAARRGGPAELLAWWEDEGRHGPIPAERVLPDLERWADAGSYDDVVRALARVPSVGETVRVVALGTDAVVVLALDAARLGALLQGPDPASAPQWAGIVRRLIALGDFDASRVLVRALDTPELQRLHARLAPVVDALPRYEIPAALRTPPGRSPGLIVIRHPDPRGTAVVLGRMSSRLLHASLVDRGLDVIHLEDHANLRFLCGIPALGDDWSSLVDGVRALVSADGPLFTMGSSGNGYAAIHLGVELGAAGVLAFAPPTTGEPESRRLGPKARAVRDRVAVTSPGLIGDLRRVLLDADVVPRTHVWYPGENARDAEAAGRLADVPGVTLRELSDGTRHNVLIELACAGRLDVALDDVLSAAV